MAAQGFLLDADGVRTVRELKRRVLTNDPAFADLGAQPSDVLPAGPPDVWVQVTSLTPTSSRYPGQIDQYTGSAGSWALLGSAGAVWVVFPNSETPALSTRYKAQCAGVIAADGKLVFVAVVPAGSAFNGSRSSKASFSLANNTATSVVFDFTYYDTSSYWDFGSDATKCTVPTTGKYFVGFQAHFTGALDGTPILRLRAYLSVNGSEPADNVTADLSNVTNSPQAIPTIGFAHELGLTAGDYLQFNVFRNVSGGSSTNVNAIAWCEFRG